MLGRKGGRKERRNAKVLKSDKRTETDIDGRHRKTEGDIRSGIEEDGGSSRQIRTDRDAETDKIRERRGE